MKYRTLAALVVANFFCVAAHAADTTLNVRAEVPIQLAIVDVDGKPLEGKKFTMEVDPGTGTLKPMMVPFKILTNSVERQFRVTVLDTTANISSPNKTVELMIRAKGKDLRRYFSYFPPTDIFDTDTFEKAGMLSKPIELTLSQIDSQVLPAGSYTGNIKILLSQDP